MRGLGFWPGRTPMGRSSRTEASQARPALLGKRRGRDAQGAGDHAGVGVPGGPSRRPPPAARPLRGRSRDSIRFRRAPPSPQADVLQTCGDVAELDGTTCKEALDGSLAPPEVRRVGRRSGTPTYDPSRRLRGRCLGAGPAWLPRLDVYTSWAAIRRTHAQRGLASTLDCSGLGLTPRSALSRLCCHAQGSITQIVLTAQGLQTLRCSKGKWAFYDAQHQLYKADGSYAGERQGRRRPGGSRGSGPRGRGPRSPVALAPPPPLLHKSTARAAGAAAAATRGVALASAGLLCARAAQPASITCLL